MPDCGDNSCRYATKRGGMRTNGGCRCDDCPECGATIHRLGFNPLMPMRKHRHWCTRQDWIPEHLRTGGTG